MTDETEEHIEVDVALLSALRNSILPMQSKVASIIGDHYSSIYKMTESQLIVFLEVHLSCMMLCRYVSDLLHQAAEVSVEKILMKPEEVVLDSMYPSSTAKQSAHRTTNSTITLNTNRVQKASDELRLRRTKRKSTENTLEQFMHLKIAN